VTYVGPDPQHAVGLDGALPDYAVVSARSSILDALAEAGVPVCPVDPSLRSSEAVLADTRVRAFLADRPRGQGLLVFKNSFDLETTAAQAGWVVLAAGAYLARGWENKLTFLEKAEALGLPTPAARRVDVALDSYADVARTLGPDFVLQAPHGYSGARTARVQDAAAYQGALQRLRAPYLRAAAYVSGRPLTLNACVTGAGVAVGRPFVQLTGEPELTRHPLGSCGNDWSAPLPCDPEAAAGAARTVGAALDAEGYRGIFGLDLVIRPDGSPAVIEVNPRLVASVALYTQLEVAEGRVPLLARHVLAHLDPSADRVPLGAHTGRLPGSQMILHNTASVARRRSPGVRSGAYVWRPSTGEVVFQRPAAHVDRLQDGEVLILASPEGRLIASGAEAGRVQCPGPISDGSGRLAAGARELAKAVQTRLLAG
jgi:biotin carboxylase